jgi:hypothetical protein
MKRIRSLLIVGIIGTTLGLFSGMGWATSQAQETSYLVIEEFELSPDMTVNDGTEATQNVEF